MFDEAALEVEKQLVKVSPGGLTYFAEQKYGRLEHKMDHLACFAGKNDHQLLVFSCRQRKSSHHEEGDAFSRFKLKTFCSLSMSCISMGMEQ